MNLNKLRKYYKYPILEPELLEFKLDHNLDIIVIYKIYSGRTSSDRRTSKYDFKLPLTITNLLCNNNKYQIELALNLIE